MMARLLFKIAFVLMAVFLISRGEARAHPAWGVAADAKGQIYFSDLENIWKIDAGGKLSLFRPGVGGRHIHELALDEAGNVYGADISYEPATKRWQGEIWKMTPASDESYIVAPTYDLPRGSSIWRDGAGNTYSFEQDNHTKRETLLLKRTPDGKVSVLAGGAYGLADGQGTQARFGSVGAMTWGADDSLYITDTHAIRKVTMDGRVTTLARDIKIENAADNPVGGGLFSPLFGIATDGSSTVYVADYGNRRVIKLTADGKLQTMLRAESPWSPTGVAFRDGNLYVREDGFTLLGIARCRVKKIAADGKVTLLATIENGKPLAPEKSSVEAAAQSLQKPLARTGMYSFILAGVCLMAIAGIALHLRKRKIQRHQS